MNESEAKKDIQFIREMIEKTKKATAESWKFFLIWGVMIIIAIIGNYILVYLEQYNWIWANWVGFMLAGVLYTFLFVRKKEKSSGTRTYAQIAIGHLTFACGIGFMLAGYIFPVLKLYSFGAIPVIISMIVGIMFFVIGGIYEWNLLKVCALIWWLSSIGMIFIHWHYRALLFVPLIIIGYIVPGFILKAQYRQNRG